MLGVLNSMSYFIIIRGPLGSGKSTIAKKLVEDLGATYVSVDEILDEHDLTTDKEEGYISQNGFLKANEIVVPEARVALEAGKPVVFDGNFYWKSAIEDLITQLSFPNVAFTLKLPVEVCIERDSKREHPHGIDAAGAVYDKVSEFDFGIPIDATKPREEIVAEIEQRITEALTEVRTEIDHEIQQESELKNNK
jgi:predicted kinase